MTLLCHPEYKNSKKNRSSLVYYALVEHEFERKGAIDPFVCLTGCKMFRSADRHFQFGDYEAFGKSTGAHKSIFLALKCQEF